MLCRKEILYFVSLITIAIQINLEPDSAIDSIIDGMDDSIIDGIDDSIIDGMEDSIIDGIDDSIIDSFDDSIIDGIDDGISDGIDSINDSNIDIDQIVEECIYESQLNNTIEMKYAQKPKTDKTTPALDGLQNKVKLQITYDRSVRQRPFECIAEKTKLYDLGENGPSRQEVESSASYQALQQTCLLENGFPICDPNYPYRSFEGTCNNLQNPKWGSTFDCTKRLLPHFYEGVAGFRQSVTGGPLPNARMLSNEFHHNRDRPSQNFTTLFAFFGQFLDHDIADSPISSIDGRRLIQCCPIEKEHHPQCAPIDVASDDFFYSQFNVTCFPVTRSAPCPICTVDQRFQMSQVTAFVDASVTYGATDEDGTYLRALDGTGKLRKREEEGQRLLPANFDVDLDKCGSADKGEFCFRAGDRRVNLHTTLMSLHTILLRQHNRIVDYLHEINPMWDGETLYQESRKIVVATFQNFVYNEFLPPLLGESIMLQYGLKVQPNTRSVYNPNLDPTILAEFNTAAFRLHSVINSVVSDFTVEDNRRLLRDQQFDAPPIYNGVIGPFVQGLCKVPSQMFDRFLVMDLTEFLYKERLGKYGFDLAAVNIQRGRDHGIPPYVYLAEYAHQGQYVIKDFDDLNALMPEENVEKLKSLYNSVYDIDAWVGINAETITPPMLVGYTMAVIIAEQFKRLKYGDRFFYEHDGQPPYFTDAQLATIKNQTISRTACDNTDMSISLIQKNSFLLPSLENPMVPCDELPPLELDLWKV